MTWNENKEETIGILESLQAVCNAKADMSIGKGKILWAGYGKATSDAIIMLKEQETKTGKWIPIESTTGVEVFGVKEMTVIDVRCSACGSEEDVSFTGYKYCPRCGAKMKGR